MEASGGSARPIIPILKSTGLLSQSGVPTELYSQFQMDSGRAAAALQALKNGYAEIFRRNQYAHRADESALADIVIAITGLNRKDQIVRYILNTFQVFQDMARNAADEQTKDDKPQPQQQKKEGDQQSQLDQVTGRIQLAYNINVVLPETTNVEVFNAIFRSLKGNLLS
jgi:hypothetical protein